MSIPSVRQNMINEALNYYSTMNNVVFNRERTGVRVSQQPEIKENYSDVVHVSNITARVGKINQALQKIQQVGQYTGNSVELPVKKEPKVLSDYVQQQEAFWDGDTDLNTEVNGDEDEIGDNNPDMYDDDYQSYYAEDMGDAKSVEDPDNLQESKGVDIIPFGATVWDNMEDYDKEVKDFNKRRSIGIGDGKKRFRGGVLPADPDGENIIGTLSQLSKATSNIKINKYYMDAISEVISEFNSLCDYLDIQNKQQPFSQKDIQEYNNIIQGIIPQIVSTISSIGSLTIDKDPENQQGYTRIYNILSGLKNSIQNGIPLQKISLSMLSEPIPILNEIKNSVPKTIDQRIMVETPEGDIGSEMIQQTIPNIKLKDSDKIYLADVFLKLYIKIKNVEMIPERTPVQKEAKELKLKELEQQMDQLGSIDNLYTASERYDNLYNNYEYNLAYMKQAVDYDDKKEANKYGVLVERIDKIMKKYEETFGFDRPKPEKIQQQIEVQQPNFSSQLNPYQPGIRESASRPPLQDGESMVDTEISEPIEQIDQSQYIEQPEGDNQLDNLILKKAFDIVLTMREGSRPLQTNITQNIIDEALRTNNYQKFFEKYNYTKELIEASHNRMEDLVPLDKLFDIAEQELMEDNQNEDQDGAEETKMDMQPIDIDENKQRRLDMLKESLGRLAEYIQDILSSYSIDIDPQLFINAENNDEYDELFDVYDNIQKQQEGILPPLDILKNMAIKEIFGADADYAAEEMKKLFLDEVEQPPQPVSQPLQSSQLALQPTPIEDSARPQFDRNDFINAIETELTYNRVKVPRNITKILDEGTDLGPVFKWYETTRFEHPQLKSIGELRKDYSYKGRGKCGGNMQVSNNKFDDNDELEPYLTKYLIPTKPNKNINVPKQDIKEPVIGKGKRKCGSAKPKQKPMEKPIQQVKFNDKGNDEFNKDLWFL